MSATDQARRFMMRTGRNAPRSKHAQALSVWGLRDRWNAAHEVSTWLRVSVSSGGKFCNRLAAVAVLMSCWSCWFVAFSMMNHPFALLRVEDDSLETGVLVGLQE